MGPVACLIHVDVVPRRAVRRVGPRSDLTRSTHIGEPCGPARLLGDGSRSSCSPYRATNQSTGGGGMKNGGRSEERRVGKECRSRWWAGHEEKKGESGELMRGGIRKERILLLDG